MHVTIHELTVERNGRGVLDVPALRFEGSATTAIFGPNGSGKTTLLRIIAMLERPTSGAVRLDGQLARPDSRTRSKIAYAFQEAVFTRGTVRENLLLALTLRRVPGIERQSRVNDVARECGVAHLLDRDTRTISGGEAQRVNLARALALRAPVTLLDEPLSGIDRVARAQLLDELPHLLQTFAAATILVTHDREEALRLAEHLVVLIDGRVRAAGPKREVFRQPPDRETAELLGHTVVETESDGVLAFAPGALQPGAGPREFTLLVKRVVNLGSHDHVIGEIRCRGGFTRADVRLPEGVAPPEPGSHMIVSAQHWSSLPSPPVTLGCPCPDEVRGEPRRPMG